MTEYTDRPPRKNLAQAIATRDIVLLRKIAAERKELTDQQRQGLTFVADLFDRAADRRRAHA